MCSNLLGLFPVVSGRLPPSFSYDRQTNQPLVISRLLSRFCSAMSLFAPLPTMLCHRQISVSAQVNRCISLSTFEHSLLDSFSLSFRRSPSPFASQFLPRSFTVCFDAAARRLLRCCCCLSAPSITSSSPRLPFLLPDGSARIC